MEEVVGDYDRVRELEQAIMRHRSEYVQAIGAARSDWAVETIRLNRELWDVLAKPRVR
jgi:hypothetical protein